MFGWKQKRDGFEWHDYVRTTILVRRAKRREHLQEMQQKAISEIANVQKRAIAVSVAGLKGLYHGLIHDAFHVRRFLRYGMKSAATFFVKVCSFVGHYAWWALLKTEKASTISWRGLGSFVQRTVPSRLALPVAIVGLALIAGSVGQFLDSGFTPLSITVGTVGLIAIAIAIICWAQFIDWASKTHTFSAVVDDVTGSNRQNKIGGTVGRLSAFVVSIIFAGFVIWIVGSHAIRLGNRSVESSMNFLSKLSFPSLFVEEQISGRAKVLTGDTLRVGDTVLRLTGIEAPMLSQTCRAPKRRKWKCGSAAAAALSKFTPTAQSYLLA